MNSWRVKISTWADLCWITTILYVIFLCCGFFISFNAIVQFGTKTYETTLNFFTWIETVNTNLADWKLYVLLISMLIIAILIDKFIIIPYFTRFTKEGKVARMELNKKYKELKEEKKNEKKK